MPSREPESSCGSPQCLVDRLEETVTKQHSESMTFVKELFTTHVGVLTREIDDVKKTIKEQGDNLYGRMREVEDRLTRMETKWNESDELHTIRACRTWAGKIVVGVAILAIVAMGGYFLFIYDTHGRQSEYQQGKK